MQKERKMSDPCKICLVSPICKAKCDDYLAWNGRRMHRKQIILETILLSITMIYTALITTTLLRIFDVG